MLIACCWEYQLCQHGVVKDIFASLRCQQLVDQKVRSYPFLNSGHNHTADGKQRRTRDFTERFAYRLVLAHASLVRRMGDWSRVTSRVTAWALYSALHWALHRALERFGSANNVSFNFYPPGLFNCVNFLYVFTVWYAASRQVSNTAVYSTPSNDPTNQEREQLTRWPGRQCSRPNERTFLPTLDSRTYYSSYVW